MHIARRYTTEGQDPFGSLKFVPRTSRITNPDGSVVFEMKDLLAPEGWSQVAVDILAQKYFRKAGVPARLERVPEEGMPGGLQRSVPAAGRLLGVLGLEGRLFLLRRRRPRLLRRDVPHAGGADGGAELAAVVQHR